LKISRITLWAINALLIGVIVGGMLLTTTMAGLLSINQTFICSGAIASTLSNSTIPPGPYNFLIVSNKTDGQYYAQAPNGTTCFTSTNCSEVINFVTIRPNTVVDVLAGDYYLSAPVLLNSYVTLAGAGIDITNFDAAASVWAYDSGLFENYNVTGYNSHITLEGFTINGESSTYQDTGVWLENVDYFTMQDVKVNSTYLEALQVNQEYNPFYSNTAYFLSNIQTYSCGLQGGAYISDTIALHSISDSTITDISINKTGWDGLLLTSVFVSGIGANCSNDFVSNCTVYGSQKSNGWNFNFNYCQNLTVSNLCSYDAANLNYGFQYDNVVQASQLISGFSGNHGIDFRQCQNVIANGLTSYNSGQVNPSNGVGVYLEDISNSQFSNIQSYSNELDGLRLQTNVYGCFNNIIADAQITNNVGEGFSLYNYASGTQLNDTQINCGIFSGNTYGIDIRSNVNSTLISGVNFAGGNSVQNFACAGTNTQIAFPIQGLLQQQPIPYQFTTNPTNLANAVDDKYSTATTVGVDNQANPWTMSCDWYFNLGFILQPCTLNLKMDNWVNASAGTFYIRVEQSNDGTNWVQTWQYQLDAGDTVQGGDNLQQYAIPFSGQYVQIYLIASNANIQFSSIMYEMQIT
jgi:hypothetical protein